MEIFAKWDRSSLDELNKVWACKYADLARNKAAMWTKVAGPISGTIATLLDAGWRPVGPGYWIEPTQNLEATLGE